MQTLEVDVVNLASNTSSGTKASCSGSISFLNSSGATIGSSIAITDLGAGAVTSATLPFASSGATSGANRTLVRAVVTVTTTVTTGVQTAPCSLQATMSLFETSSGDTDVIIQGSSIVSSPVGPISPANPVSPQR